jgi:hypothetical protein
MRWAKNERAQTLKEMSPSSQKTDHDGDAGDYPNSREDGSKERRVFHDGHSLNSLGV